MLEVRACLEGMAASLAAQRASEDGLIPVREALLRMEEAFSIRDLEAFVTGNEDFHNAIYAASGNQFLNVTIQDIMTRTWYERAASWESFGDVPRNIREHRQILKAIEERDTEGARREAEQHVINAVNVLEGRRLLYR